MIPSVTTRLDDGPGHGRPTDPPVPGPTSGRDLPRKPSGLWRSLGPGLVTGAADDDPSGIATYSQVGAQFGYQLGWVLLFSYPLMAVTQAIAARIGCVTGRGIAQNLRGHYPAWLLRGAVLLLLVANVVNLGADLGAMGAALQLLVPGPLLLFTAGFGAASVTLEVLLSYRRYAAILKWLTLSLLAYVGVVFSVHVEWGEAMRDILVPHVVLDGEHATALVAVLGTTISPYLFFWQASQEVEEQRRRTLGPLSEAPERVGPELARMRIDTWIGMGLSNLVSLFIIVATAATLHAAGVTQIDTSSQAAEALRPLAGRFAFALFSCGIIGTGLLAVPVLAGSASYAVCEVFEWAEGLDRRFRDARAFYGVIAFATAFGVGLNVVGLDPVRALYWSAVLNGLLAAPLMATMLVMAANPRVMGGLVISRATAVVGWIAAAVMLAASVAFLVL